MGNLSENGYNRYGSFSISSIKQASLLHGMETRSREPRNICVAANIDGEVSICLPTILSDFCGVDKAGKGKDQYDMIASYSLLLTMPTQKPLLIPNQILILRAIRKSSSFNSNSGTITSCTGFQRTLAARGISERVAKLISNSRRESLISSYESAWHKWSCWCGERKVDPFQCSVKYDFDFSAELLEKVFADQTAGVHRSAISA